MAGNPKNLVGYCGLYCGACGIYQGKIKQAVENLRGLLGAYGFDKAMPELSKWEPSFQHYAEFEKVNDALVKLFGSCPNCVGDGGDPSCAVRQCCKQKGYATCAECDEMGTCSRLQHPLAKKELGKIKAMGLDKWVGEMQKKVTAGYCYLDDKTR